MRVTAIYYLIGVLLLITEGLFVYHFFAMMQKYNWMIVLHVVIVYLIFYACYGHVKKALLLAAVLGLIFDIVNAGGIIGIYTVIYPLLVSFAVRIYRKLPRNDYFAPIFSFISVALVEILVYIVYSLIGKINMTLPFYVEHRLLPTMVVNLIVVLILMYPLQKLCAKKWGWQ